MRCDETRRCAPRKSGSKWARPSVASLSDARTHSGTDTWASPTPDILGPTPTLASPHPLFPIYHTGAAVNNTQALTPSVPTPAPPLAPATARTTQASPPPPFLSVSDPHPGTSTAPWRRPPSPEKVNLNAIGTGE
ncbi:hypothetical protein DAI22_07g276200 [Oryza sativa Japonica Group]|nr:hypothetical protein DAI22_07g276200 [Oryza sativa Japonica Group]